MSDSASQNGRTRVAASDVEAIVREVLARLAGAESRVATRIEATMKSPPTTDERSLLLTERVVTTRLLEGRLAGVATVSVAARAVVTPAARDLLRERKIALRRGDAAEAATKAAPAARLVIGVAETHFDPAALVARVKPRLATVEQLPRVGLAGVVSELADRVRLGGDRGVLFTGEPQVALVLANRHPGVRAVAVGCADSMRRARAAIGPNVLVIQPRGKSSYQMESAVIEFSSGACECPPQYREALK
ncbi:MAG: hypothetical protein K1X71_09625 [Pirellulales bacterium]|nr:hypothetical protein [Pirellulales bacterium]